MEDPLNALRRRAEARGWRPTDIDGEWYTESADGSEVAKVLVVDGGAYEARVWRYETGPTPGPDPEPAHGPQLFEACDDALDYAESNLGSDRRPPR